jgi:hypothetical protein
MLDAYIIEKIRREQEEREWEQWQPVPLPLEEYEPPSDRKQEKEKDREERGVVILELSAASTIKDRGPRINESSLVVEL